MKIQDCDKKNEVVHLPQAGRNRIDDSSRLLFNRSSNSSCLLSIRLSTCTTRESNKETPTIAINPISLFKHLICMGNGSIRIKRFISQTLYDSETVDTSFDELE